MKTVINPLALGNLFKVLLNLRSTSKTLQFSAGSSSQTFSKLRYFANCSRTNSTMNNLDDIQVKLLQEECILVDKDDNNIGSASKKICHLLKNIDNGMLHRAFSVFLFNKHGEMLIQQRSDAKITFPGHWTNTCCSHPLNWPQEVAEDRAVGVRRAAQRKLKHELGVEPDEVPVDDFHYLTRIHYRSNNVPDDKTWGEHEIDYILFAQREVTIVPNENEVKDYMFLSKEKLKEFIEGADNKGLLLTPWFRLIAKTFLFKWWDDLDALKQHEDHTNIHRML